MRPAPPDPSPAQLLTRARSSPDPAAGPGARALAMAKGTRSKAYVPIIAVGMVHSRPYCARSGLRTRFRDHRSGQEWSGVPASVPETPQPAACRLLGWHSGARRFGDDPHCVEGGETAMKPIRTFRVIPSLPAPLKRVPELPHNLPWPWNLDTITRRVPSPAARGGCTPHRAGAPPPSQPEHAVSDRPHRVGLTRRGSELSSEGRR